MTAYATLPEFIDQIEGKNAAGDDTFIEALLERASAEFCADTQRTFHAYEATFSFDMPHSRCLELSGHAPDPLLSVTTITNGDDTNISSDQYLLYPLNGIHKNEIRLKQSGTVVWQFGASAETEGVITVSGTWGYVDRDATDPVSVRVVANSNAAVLLLATHVYRKRHGQEVEGAARITGAGVVITPKDKPAGYWDLVHLYAKKL